MEDSQEPGAAASPREASAADRAAVILTPDQRVRVFISSTLEELAAERIDVLVTRGPSADYTKAVRERIPVVFAYSGDPVLAGFGDSLARPGRNMTGITFMAMELAAKRIDVLKELLPGARQQIQKDMGEAADRLWAELNKPGKTLVVMDMAWLLPKDGLLDRLKARGATVGEPPQLASASKPEGDDEND